jgi:uncharacterized protein (TIGR00251 family)
VLKFIHKDGTLIFSVRVLPKSSKSEIVGEHDGALKVKIKAPPVDGAANAELIKTLAVYFDVPKSAVEIVKGQTSKTKQVKINGITTANLPDLKTA